MGAEIFSLVHHAVESFHLLHASVPHLPEIASHAIFEVNVALFGEPLEEEPA